jgi:hypothetical protein
MKKPYLSAFHGNGGVGNVKTAEVRKKESRTLASTG